MASDRPDPNKLYVAVESFMTAGGGQASAGITQLWGDDPLVRSHPQFFRLSEQNRPDVEDASAAPGVKRGSTR